MSPKNIAEENKALIRRWFEEVWNQGRVERIPEMFADNGIAHGMLGDPSEPLRGLNDIGRFHRLFRGAFPQLQVIVEEQVAEGNKVATRCTFSGKNSKKGFKASHARKFTGLTIARIENGEIVEAWSSFDSPNMYLSLGDFDGPGCRVAEVTTW